MGNHLAYPQGDIWLKNLIDEKGSSLKDEPDLRDEVFPLDNLSCVSSKGRVPGEETDVLLQRGKSYENDITSYPNPQAKFPGKNYLGFFRNKYNLIDSPEDLRNTNPNWSVYASSATVEASGSTFNGSRFTKIQGNNTVSQATIQQTFTSEVGSISVISGVFKRGTSANSAIRFDTTGNRLTLRIEWATKTVTLTTGTDLYYEWYGDDIVYVRGISTAATATSGILLISGAYDESGNTTDYSYATQIQVIAYGSSSPPRFYPYIKSSNEGAKLQYSFNYDQVGSIECWVKPEFTYDINTYCVIFGDNEGTSNWNIILQYDTTERFKFLIKGDTTEVNLFAGNDGGVWSDTNTFQSGETYLNEWMHFKVVWDVPNDNYYLYVNGVLIDSDEATDIGVFTPNDILQIGNSTFYNYNYSFGGYITDFCYKPYLDQTNNHYTNNVPYSVINRVEGKDQNFFIDNFGNATFKDLITDKGTTASIVEVGSNVNGSYIKFSDGTMICRYVSNSILTTNTPGAGVYYKSLSLIFPHSYYKEAPHISTGSRANFAFGLGGPASGVGKTAFVFNLVGLSTDTSARPVYIAIGKWK